jgi:hypothetical protein
MFFETQIQHVRKRTPARKPQMLIERPTQALLTATEAAKLLRVETKTRNDWARESKASFVLIGITRRYLGRDLEAWIEAKKVIPTEEETK